MMMDSRPAKPLPAPTTLSRPFWDGCRDSRLLVQRCSTCGAHVFLPQEFCPSCLGIDLEWVEGAGKGVIVTFTVIGRAQTPAFSAPYVVAVVRLDEGYEMLTNIVGTEPNGVMIGSRVEVNFVRENDEIALPCFRLSA